MQAHTSGDPFKRRKTKRSGVTYREKSDGSRTYFAYARGSQHKVDGGFDEACALQDELRGKVRRNEPIVTQKHTFAEAAEAWFLFKSPSWNELTYEAHRRNLDNHVLPVFADKRLPIHWQEVVEFIRSLDCSGATQQNILKPLKGTLRYAVRQGWASSNPFDALEREELPKAESRKPELPTPAQLQALLTAANKTGWRELIEVACHGPRKGEILGFVWGDFDSSTGTLTLDKQWRKDRTVADTKTGNHRTLALDPGTAHKLTALRLRSKHSQDSDPIFGTSNGTHLSHANAHRTWNAIREAAGLPGFHFHDLRHVFSSALHAAGATDAELAAAGGWANADLPKSVYTHVSDAEKAAERVRAAVGGVLGGTS
jgi:integrase